MKSAVLVFGAASSLAFASQPSPEIIVSDVDRFYAIYDAAGGRPTQETLQKDYLDHGSAGLAEFARLRRITGERIAAMMAEKPALYTDARRCVAVLPEVKADLAVALGKLAALYPKAVFPPVTLAVGRGKPVGTANASGVMIGLEALCAVDFMNPDPRARFLHVIAHEYGHVLQPGAQVESDDTTVLEASVIEGGAEFVAELTSGAVSYGHLQAATKGREAQIERAFVADLYAKAQGSKWLYNGLGTAEWPGDLGYWVGWRIAGAYYRNAADKQAAVREIIEVRDAKAFLEKSGWKPGAAAD